MRLCAFHPPYIFSSDRAPLLSTVSNASLSPINISFFHCLRFAFARVYQLNNLHQPLCNNKFPPHPTISLSPLLACMLYNYNSVSLSPLCDRSRSRYLEPLFLVVRLFRESIYPCSRIFLIPPLQAVSLHFCASPAYLSSWPCPTHSLAHTPMFVGPSRISLCLHWFPFVSLDKQSFFFLGPSLMLLREFVYYLDFSFRWTWTVNQLFTFISSLFSSGFALCVRESTGEWSVWKGGLVALIITYISSLSRATRSSALAKCTNLLGRCLPNMNQISDKSLVSQ